MTRLLVREGPSVLIRPFCWLFLLKQKVPISFHSCKLVFLSQRKRNFFSCLHSCHSTRLIPQCQIVSIYLHLVPSSAALPTTASPPHTSLSFLYTVIPDHINVDYMKQYTLQKKWDKKWQRFFNVVFCSISRQSSDFLYKTHAFQKNTFVINVVVKLIK